MKGSDFPAFFPAHDNLFEPRPENSTLRPKGRREVTETSNLGQGVNESDVGLHEGDPFDGL